MLEEGGAGSQVTLARPQGKVKCPGGCILESAPMILSFWACLGLCSGKKPECLELTHKRAMEARPSPPCISRSALGPFLLP